MSSSSKLNILRTEKKLHMWKVSESQPLHPVILAQIYALHRGTSSPTNVTSRPEGFSPTTLTKTVFTRLTNVTNLSTSAYRALISVIKKLFKCLKRAAQFLCQLAKLGIRKCSRYQLVVIFFCYMLQRVERFKKS